MHKAINGLSILKDCGPMGIQDSYIKHNSSIIAPVLLDMFNLILENGIFPENWKQSFITPIPKKGNSVDVANYRGIAQQSVVPKLFDKLLTQKLYQFVSVFIPSGQHGFMPKRSTQTNLHELSEFIYESFAKRSTVDVVYFDFSKAFDRMDHGLLAAKLAKLSMPYELFRCIMNFFSGRSYKLKACGIEYDESFAADCGVPQGSYIGPLLFILFKADIISCTIGTATQSSLYADDTKFCRVVNNINDSNLLQKAVDNLVDWSRVNSIDLNAAKTQHVTYHGRRTIAYSSTVYIGGIPITKSDTVRDLGVYFDSQMNFGFHVDQITARVNAIYGLGYRFIKEINHPHMILKIFDTYAVPILEYC